MADRYSSTSRRETESCNFHCSNPSFSSTLLDAICRSIDQGEEEVLVYGETMGKKESLIDSANVRAGHVFRSEEDIANFQRACMIEKWMEKKVGEKVAVRRKSMAAADLLVKKSFKDGEEISSSSSCDSSCGGGSGSAGFFSSSDAESFRGKRPKPIRVGDLGMENEKFGRHEKPSKNQDGFLKTKSRALKIYGDLKKVKQPISPGARLAGFLNSLFTGAGNPRKPKTNSSDIRSPITKSANASTCSSASSFSRSCLSKTPSSRGKPTAGEKRSVRFSPVSVIVDEECQPPRGHKSLHEEINFTHKKHSLEAINEEIMVQVMEKNRRVEEAARDLLRNYQHKLDREFPFDFTDSRVAKNQPFHQEFEQEDEEDEDDAVSYASSDLFELDNLSTIGMERYMEELPVYETTHLRSNRAIANRLIM